MQEEISTRERIKRAARRLFALNGVDAVAVRDIIAAAGQKNASALNYYFGSKEGLIETLIGDALAIAHARWDAALDALEAAGGPRTIREVVEIAGAAGPAAELARGRRGVGAFPRHDPADAARSGGRGGGAARAHRLRSRAAPYQTADAGYAGARARSAAAVLFLGLDGGVGRARRRGQARTAATPNPGTRRTRCEISSTRWSACSRRRGPAPTRLRRGEQRQAGGSTVSLRTNMLRAARRPIASDGCREAR